MEHSFTIGQVSQILGVPAATLRFWEEKGLFDVRKTENCYRSYTGQDIIQIANVMFLRNLGVPVSKVQELEHYSLPEYLQQLRQLQDQLEEKILNYQSMYRQAQMQYSNLAEVRRLQQTPGQFESVPFDAVEPFNFMEQDKILRYIQKPSRYVRFFDTRDMSTETRCIVAASDTPDQQLLWKKQPESRFITILIREKAEQNYDSDIHQALSLVRQHYRTGVILAQYLITAIEHEERVDFLKGFVEVFPL